MTRLGMIISSTARPGKRNELYDLYREHLAPRAEANENQEVVVWSEDQQNEDVFHLFELYRDAESFQANAGSEFFAAYMEKAMPLLAGEPEVRLVNPRWATGVEL